MQAAQGHVDAALPVAVRQFVGAVGVGDVRFDDGKVRAILGVDALHVFVPEAHFVLRRAKRRQRRQP